MKDKIKALKDVFKATLQEDIANLNEAGALEFRDSAKARGITITLELSASGKVINNRIYPPKGQRDQVDTWVKPYAKPILLHHNTLGDALGRVVSVEYQDNSQEAMKFFKSLKDFQAFKDDMESDVPARIYKAMVRNNLITNKDWPGIGKLIAKARVTDNDAIDKFVDQRYLTFSAGSHSDRYVCGACNSNWATGEVCDHQPGSITEDGDPVVMITGKFIADELSVVNNPANRTSVVRSIQLDAEEDSAAYNDFVLDESMIYSVDSQTEIEAITDYRQITYDAIKTGNFKVIEDALNGKNLGELKLLTSVHDSLHSHYDWQIKYEGEDAVKNLPRDVLKMHAELHKMAMDGKWRDSLINGPLDNYSASGDETKEFAYAEKKSKDNEIAVPVLVDWEKVQTYIDSKFVAAEKIENIVPAVDMISKEDYAAALSQIENLQKDLEKLKNTSTLLDTENNSEQNVDRAAPAKVENPSIAGKSDENRIQKNLGDFEKSIIQRYLDIKQKSGKSAADSFIRVKKSARYIPTSFNIQDFIQEND